MIRCASSGWIISISTCSTSRTATSPAHGARSRRLSRRVRFARLAELMSNVKPAVNQIEVSPWYQEKDEVRFAQEQDVQVEAWAPFAEGKHHIFTDPTIAAIGEKYGKTNGQVILRWLLQRGIVAIPKSVHKERMAENFDVFDFELSDEDMATMASLDKHESQFFDHRDPTAIVSIFGQSLRALRS